MKTRKWIWWTLAVILTLVVLAAAGFAGYRVGYARGLTANPNAKDFMAGPFWRGQGHMQNLDKNFDQRGPVPGQEFGGRQFDRFDGRNFDRFNGRGGFPFFAPLFGLVRLAVLAVLIWLGYKLVKNSGWRLTRVTAEPAPVAEEVPAPKRAKK